MNRRKFVTGSGAVVLAPSFIGVASAATDSGNIEVETTATIPTDTTIAVRVYEDLGGTGSVDNQQEKEIQDSTVTTEYGALDGTEAQGNIYWLEITLSTSDETTTPELDTATITLPESDGDAGGGGTTPTNTPENPEGLSSILDNHLFFIAALVTGTAAIGVASGSLAVGSIAAYLVFAYIALEVSTSLLTNIVMVTIVLITIGFAFKFWRLEGMGE